jgi:hypothetical protein
MQSEQVTAPSGNRVFPTPEAWRQLTGIKSRGSHAFQRLDAAYLAYVRAQNTTDDVGREFKELQQAFKEYEDKKIQNANGLHLFGKTNRDTNHVLENLKNFLAGGQPSAEENINAVNYTFERLLRLRVSLGGAKVQLKQGTAQKALSAAIDKYKSISKHGFFGSASFIEDLKEQAERVDRANQTRGNILAHAETAQGFYSAAKSVQKTVTETKNLLQEGTSIFNNNLSRALGVKPDDPVFLEIVTLGSQAFGSENFKELVSVIPVLNTVVGAGKLVKNIADAASLYNKHHECNAVKTTIVAPGDATEAIAGLERMLEVDFNKATVAVAEGTTKLVAGLDVSGAAGAVVGATWAVAHLFEGMVTFGLQYYQMLAANKVLDSWDVMKVKLDGEIDLVSMASIGLGSNTNDIERKDKFRARHSVGDLKATHFIGAMRECPLLGCYFLTKSPAADLLEIVSADLQANMNKPFFSTIYEIDVGRIEKLRAYAQDVLNNSRFEVTQDLSQRKTNSDILENANIARVQTAKAEFAAKLTSNIANRQAAAQAKYIADQDKIKNAHRLNFLELNSAVGLILKKRLEAENAAHNLLKEGLEKPEEVDPQRLEKRKKGVIEALDVYDRETSGIHRLHTWRNDESVTAQTELRKLCKLTGTPGLIQLEAVVTYLISKTNCPANCQLRPLKGASRLKKLLKEYYEKA